MRRNSNRYQNAIGKLKEVKAKVVADEAEFQEMMEAKDSVLRQYGEIFSQENIPTITVEEFHSFLLFSNNKHWSGLQRHSPKMTEDIERLQEGLSLLVNEDQHLQSRLDEAIELIPGMGKAVATAILLVAFPQKYGVWNNTSEQALKQLDLWPEFERGTSFGERYVEVNHVLNDLAADLGLDLWTLDVLFYALDRDTEDEDDPEVGENGAQLFGLEKHLHEFLRDNWDNTSLGTDWAIYQEPGDSEAGYKYPCKVGEIDILARHKTEDRFLVIELKKNKSSDRVVGQILRYMGWARRELAQEDETVEGLIILHESNEKLEYALSATTDIRMMIYEVDFALSEHAIP